MRVGIVAGEPSGDLLGASLIKALKHLHPQCEFVGVGGREMLAAGCQSLYDMERLSVMGLIEPLKHLPDLLCMQRGLIQYFQQNKPQVFIGIDSPDFNLHLARKLRIIGIPTVHYVSPSVWAWRKNRIKSIAKSIDLMLTLLPFEAEFYQQHHVPVRFVGHPLADQIPLMLDKIAARKTLGLDPFAPTIALLPGSRKQEIKYLGEVFLQTAMQCVQHNPEIRVISSMINNERAQEFRYQQQKVAPHLPLSLFQQQSQQVMAAADVVLVASGTATLETLLCKRPMVIAYRMNEFTYRLARLLVKIPFFGLPNLLANEMIVPEFLQQAATPDNLSAALLDFLQHRDKTEQLENKFLQMHEMLRCDASRKAAEAVSLLVSC